MSGVEGAAAGKERQIPGVLKEEKDEDVGGGGVMIDSLTTCHWKEKMETSR